MLSFFIFVTLLHDYEKAFYLQYKKFYVKLKYLDSGSQSQAGQNPNE